MKRTLLLFLVLLMAITVFGASQAVTDSVGVKRVDMLNYFGNAFDVFVSGDYAYVAYALELAIIDISDSTNPQIVGYYNTKTSYNLTSVYVSGDYAYVTADMGGVYIINISDPANPTQASHFTPSGAMQDIIVDGNYAYIAGGSSGLYIYNVSNPASPSYTGIYDDGTSAWANGIAKDGNYVYIAYDDELYIVDVSTPSVPAHQGHVAINAPGTSMSVAVMDTFAFTANFTNGSWSNGLTIYNVNDKTNPTVITNADTYGYSRDICLSGDYAFIADDGLYVIDITNPAAPVFADTLFTNTDLYGVYVAGNLAFAADNSDGLRVIDVTNVNSMSELGNIKMTGFPFNSVINGNYAYLACGNGGLKVIDISDSMNMNEVYSFTTANARGLQIIGDTLYLADRSQGLMYFDISTPDTPVLLSTTYISLANDVFVVDTLAYVATMFGGCDIYNIKNILSASLVYAFPTSWTYTCWVDGDYAYLADGFNGLRIYDVSDPSSPDTLGRISTGGEVCDVIIHDTLAFIASGGAGVFRYNIKDPSNPVQLDVYDTPGSATAIDYDPDSNFVYIADGSNGLLVIQFDGSKGYNLVMSMTIALLSSFIAITHSQRTMLISAEGEGYIRARSDRTITGLDYRNVSMTKPDMDIVGDMLKYSVNRFGNVHLSLYDASGRFIRNIVDANKAPGEYSANIDKSGLSNGTYFISGSIGSYSAAHKMLIIK